jgi:hypothetical protein
VAIGDGADLIPVEPFEVSYNGVAVVLSAEFVSPADALTLKPSATKVRMPTAACKRMRIPSGVRDRV